MGCFCYREESMLIIYLFFMLCIALCGFYFYEFGVFNTQLIIVLICMELFITLILFLRICALFYVKKLFITNYKNIEMQYGKPVYKNSIWLKYCAKHNEKNVRFFWNFPYVKIKILVYADFVVFKLHRKAIVVKDYGLFNFSSTLFIPFNAITLHVGEYDLGLQIYDKKKYLKIKTLLRGKNK